METGQPSPHTRSDIVLRCLGGAGMGALVVTVPFAAGYAAPVGIPQITLAGLVVVASGILSCLWGQRFVDAVSRTLDSTSV